MSRIGKKPVNVPKGVDIKFDGNIIKVKGPKGELKRELHPRMKVKMEGSVITVERPSDDGPDRALHGLTRSLISNMVVGVTDGFTKKLEVNGVGYKAAVKGEILNLSLGYSHPIDMRIPKGMNIVIEKNVMAVSGFDKEALGQFCAEIRMKRPPEPYKGKGIKYETERIRRKEGKKGL